MLLVVCVIIQSFSTSWYPSSPHGDMEGKLPKISLHGEPCKRKDVYAIACAMTVEVGRSRKVYQTDDGDVVRVPQTFKQTSVGYKHGHALRYMQVIGRLMRTTCSCGSLTGHDGQGDV